MKSSPPDDSECCSKLSRLQSSLVSNLTEMRRLYLNWKRGEADPIKSRSMQDWAIWRTRVNESLISPASHETVQALDAKIQPHVASFLAYVGLYGDKGADNVALEPEAYMFYGLPRAKIDEGMLKQQQLLIQQQTKSMNPLVPNKLTIDDGCVDSFQAVRGKLIRPSIGKNRGFISFSGFRGW